MILRGLHWWFGQVGFDPIVTIRAAVNTPRLVRDYLRFRSSFKGRLNLKPCLHDFDDTAGATTSEYFWQDLTIARAIYEAKPNRHVDVGSRIDGFVAHVASFREIEVLDIRPLPASIPGVVFRQVDLMKESGLDGYCDSLSCLHALEHFGLGRYGDKIDATGPERGIAQMSKLLANGGTFYLSTPIGQERVEFNANWVFSPLRIVEIAAKHGLVLLDLSVFREGQVRSFSTDDTGLQTLAEMMYSLGMFRFSKVPA